MRRVATQLHGRFDPDEDQSSALGRDVRSGVGTVRRLFNVSGPHRQVHDARVRDREVEDVRRSRQLTIHQRCEWFSIAAGMGALLVGLLVLLGWAGQSEPLMRVLPGLATMNPFTAIGFVMAGLALVWLRRPPAGRSAETLTMSAPGKLFAVLVLLIGFVELASQGFGIFQSWLHAGPEGNQMAPNTALNFCLFGLALLAIGTTTRAGRRPTEYLALLVALLSLLALIGYAYDVQALYTVPGFIAMALNTAIVCFVLAIGILCARPDAGFMARVTSDGMSGLLIRRLFPAALLVFVMGWLGLEGERRGLYGRDMEAALFTFANILMFGAMVLWSVVALDRLDRERKRAEAGRDQALALTRMIMDNSPDVICVLDQDRRFVEVSAAASTLWGYAPVEMVGRVSTEFVHPDDVARSTQAAVSIKSGQPVVDFSNRYVCKDGHAVDVDWSAVWSAKDGLMFCVARDATERKKAQQMLRESEERLRMMVAGVRDYAILMLDAGSPYRHLECGAPSASRDTGPRTSSAGISRSFIPLRTSSAASPIGNCRSPPRKGAARTKDGGCARTARDFSPASSSPRCATSPESCADFQGHARHHRAQASRAGTRSLHLFGLPRPACAAAAHQRLRADPGGGCRRHARRIDATLPRCHQHERAPDGHAHRRPARIFHGWAANRSNCGPST